MGLKNPMTKQTRERLKMLSPEERQEENAGGVSRSRLNSVQYQKEMRARKKKRKQLKKYV